MDELRLDKFHEECGIFGIFGHPEASTLTQLGLFALQHRGQEACGIVSSDGAELHQFRSKGLVADVLNEDVLQKACRARVRSATLGIRRPAKTRSTRSSRSPSLASMARSRSAITAICRLPKPAAASSSSDGAIFSSTSDTETILHGIATNAGEDSLEAIKKVLAKNRGSIFAALSHARLLDRRSRSARISAACAGQI